MGLFQQNQTSTHIEACTRIHIQFSHKPFPVLETLIHSALDFSNWVLPMKFKPTTKPPHREDSTWAENNP